MWDLSSIHLQKIFFLRSIAPSCCCAPAPLLAAVAAAAPRVIVISLDGATPRLVDQHMASGALSPTQGLGLLQNKGIHAEQNTTVSPSLTAPGHIAIATGSTAAHNDIVANTFHLVASPFNTNVSGFSAPIGGYESPAMVLSRALHRRQSRCGWRCKLPASLSLLPPSQAQTGSTSLCRG